jgi:hypothetical protein
MSVNDCYLRELTLRTQQLDNLQASGWKASGSSPSNDKLLAGFW